MWGHAPADTLLYPPGSIGAKAGPSLRVKIIDGLYKPEISLLNQVAEAHSPIAVLFRDINDQSKIAAHQMFSGLLVVLLNNQLA